MSDAAITFITIIYQNIVGKVIVLIKDKIYLLSLVLGALAQ